jgi:hypothetical protein
MPDFPPLRQPELASFRVPFIPRLKPGVYWLFLLNPPTALRELRAAMKQVTF